MSDLTERLRVWLNSTHPTDPSKDATLIWEAADALEAAEAKLAAIDALHRRAILVGLCDYCDQWWPCETHCILHSVKGER